MNCFSAFLQLTLKGLCRGLWFKLHSLLAFYYQKHHQSPCGYVFFTFSVSHFKFHFPFKCRHWIIRSSIIGQTHFFRPLFYLIEINRKMNGRSANSVWLILTRRKCRRDTGNRISITAHKRTTCLFTKVPKSIRHKIFSPLLNIAPNSFLCPAVGINPHPTFFSTHHVRLNLHNAIFFKFSYIKMITRGKKRPQSSAALFSRWCSEKLEYLYYTLSGLACQLQL